MKAIITLEIQDADSGEAIDGLNDERIEKIALKAKEAVLKVFGKCPGGIDVQIYLGEEQSPL